MDSVWYYWLAFMLVLLVIGFVGSKIKDKKIDNFSDETKEAISNLKQNFGKKTTMERAYMDKNSICMVFSCGKNRTVYIIKDSKTNKYSYLISENKLEYGKPIISIKPFLDTKYHYNEEKLVYTGATVGGITTGGFHIEGGDYSKNHSWTGKYLLTCQIIESSVENYAFDEIYLNSDLLNKAKQSKMKQYIKGRTNHLVLFHKLSQETSQNLGTATLLGDASLDGAYNKMLNIATTEMSLTKKECEEIKDWILSNIN